MEFLAELRRQVRGKLLVIWDGLAVHRSRHVEQWVGRTGGALTLTRLPAYAPELNPVEYIWGHLKKHALADFCPKDFAQLGREARRGLRRARAIAAMPCPVLANGNVSSVAQAEAVLTQTKACGHQFVLVCPSFARASISAVGATSL